MSDSKRWLAVRDLGGISKHNCCAVLYLVARFRDFVTWNTGSTRGSYAR